MIKKGSELKAGDIFYCPPLKQTFRIKYIIDCHAFGTDWKLVYANGRQTNFAFELDQTVGVVSHLAEVV